MRYAVPCDPPKWATVKFSGGQVSNIIGLPVQLSELSQYDDSNVLTHGGLANRTKRGRRPLDMPDDKNKVGNTTVLLYTGADIWTKMNSLSTFPGFRIFKMLVW
jgi:hypothetical protein